MLHHETWPMTSLPWAADACLVRSSAKRPRLQTTIKAFACKTRSPKKESGIVKRNESGGVPPEIALEPISDEPAQAGVDWKVLLSGCTQSAPVISFTCWIVGRINREEDVAASLVRIDGFACQVVWRAFDRRSKRNMYSIYFQIRPP